ncbi:hypothetical protein ANN_21989 [Periplaneta americana]|uniref:Uncharacterized protein n=1 Tax=Periplaneta americana TaxID=6978 RepID=A0ABQ8S7E8_PERAM|nr:hypothetical protein ANN_21989 [Periplaneta americana]
MVVVSVVMKAKMMMLEIIVRTCSADNETFPVKGISSFANYRKTYKFPLKEKATEDLRNPFDSVNTPFFLQGKSNATQLTLRHVQLSLSGRYSCEVSADAPSFHTALVSGDMDVVGNQPKRESNPRPNATPDRQASVLADRATPVARTSLYTKLTTCLSANDVVSNTRFFCVNGIGDSEIVFGDMRTGNRHGLADIRPTVRKTLGKLNQRCITYVSEKLHSKYGVHSEEYLPIRTSYEFFPRRSNSISKITSKTRSAARMTSRDSKDKCSEHSERERQTRVTECALVRVLMGKQFSHEISASVWDRYPPSIVMHLGSYDSSQQPTHAKRSNFTTCELGSTSDNNSREREVFIELKETIFKKSITDQVPNVTSARINLQYEVIDLQTDLVMKINCKDLVGAAERTGTASIIIFLQVKDESITVLDKQ